LVVLPISIGLLLLLLALPPLAAYGALLSGGTALPLRAPWSGGPGYELAIRPCARGVAAQLVFSRRPAYYQRSLNNDLLRLPLAPPCR
jgi:hypothetical protein